MHASYQRHLNYVRVLVTFVILFTVHMIKLLRCHSNLECNSSFHPSNVYLRLCSIAYYHLNSHRKEPLRSAIYHLSFAFVELPVKRWIKLGFYRFIRKKNRFLLPLQKSKIFCPSQSFYLNKDTSDLIFFAKLPCFQV